MIKIKCIKASVDPHKLQYGCFIIEPLEIGQAITLGNSLRRTLLSDLTTFGITHIIINNLKHQFVAIEGLKEDYFEFILNLKEIIFKENELNLNCNSLKGFLNIKGPIILNAGMIILDNPNIKILNTKRYLGTLINNNNFYLEIDIQKGKGYTLNNDQQSNNLIKQTNNLSFSKPNKLAIDTLYTCVKRVNFNIKLIHDINGKIQESLIIEIWTNGSLTPKRSLNEAIKILLNIFSSLLINSKEINKLLI